MVGSFHSQELRAGYLMHKDHTGSEPLPPHEPCVLKGLCLLTKVICLVNLSSCFLKLMIFYGQSALLFMLS